MTDDDALPTRTDGELAEVDEALLEKVDAYFDEHYDDLERRRWARRAAGVGLAHAGARAAYRRGLLALLPTLRRLETEDETVWDLQMRPDRGDVAEGTTEAIAYGLVLALTATGGERRASTRPWLSLAAAGISACQSASALVELIAGFGRSELEVSSILDAAIGGATLSLLLPEALRALEDDDIPEAPDDE